MEIESSHVALDRLSRDGPLVRSVSLLRLLATAGRRGASLTVLAVRTGLANSTVHRLLGQLLDLRLVMQLEGSRRYVIGPLAYELGLVASQQFDIRQLCRPSMAQLAEQSSEAVYLIQRSGNEAVCVDLWQGPTAVRVITLQIGSRRPLGLGAGGLAILSALPDDECEEVLSSVISEIERDWRFPEADLRASLQSARTQGYALIRNRVTAGVTAIGKSFDDSLGRPFGAVTIAGLNARLTDERVATLRHCLDAAALGIEKALRSHQWARHATRFE